MLLEWGAPMLGEPPIAVRGQTVLVILSNQASPKLILVLDFVTVHNVI